MGSLASAGVDYEQLEASFGKYFSIGQALTSLSATDLAWLWEDFFTSSANLHTGWTQFSAGSATALAGQSGDRGGIYTILSNATANSTIIPYSVRKCIANCLTDKWYVAGRLRIPTAVDAQTVCGVGLFNNAQNTTIMGGANGNNTTNFTLSYGGIYLGSSVLDLGLAIDTVAHVYEMWGLGDNKVYGRIDGGGTVSATIAGPVDQSSVAAIARNGTTAANRQSDVDWILALTPRI